MQLAFDAEVIQWRGPAPFYFLAVPEPLCEDVRVAARDVSYGWGVVPVSVRIGATTWSTSLFPKDGGYLVPLKDRVRSAEDISEGDLIEAVLTV